jgi:hypothetical protein
MQAVAGDALCQPLPAVHGAVSTGMKRQRWGDSYRRNGLVEQILQFEF